MMAASKSDNPHDRDWGGRALENTKRDSVVPTLKVLAKDRDSIVRQMTVSALEMVGSADAYTTIREMLNDPDSDVRRLAKASLGKHLNGDGVRC